MTASPFHWDELAYDKPGANRLRPLIGSPLLKSRITRAFSLFLHPLQAEIFLSPVNFPFLAQHRVPHQFKINFAAPASFTCLPKEARWACPQCCWVDQDGYTFHYIVLIVASSPRSILIWVSNVSSSACTSYELIIEHFVP